VYVVDLADVTALRSRGAWAVDRVHPSVEGHRAMASAALDALAAQGYRVPRRIDVPDQLPGYSRFAEFRWLARHGAPYLARKARQGHLRDWATDQHQPAA
jgi:hypothetical protein